MSEEKDFFKTCFNIIAGLEVKNESQAIAKEVVLDEIENLQQENNQLKHRIDKTNNLINTILNLDYDKFCNYDTYINSIIEIKEELKGEKDEC